MRKVQIVFVKLLGVGTETHPYEETIPANS